MVPAGKRIQFLSLRTLFQALTKILLRRTGNTGHKSVPDLVATTDFKIGTISACLPSTQPASANNWAGSSLINQPSSKSTCRLVLFKRNTETGALPYHHPSANNNLVLEQPFLVFNQDDLERLYDQISNIDFLEWVRQQRPSRKWVVDLITNVTWFVWKMGDHPIGWGKYLPGYIVENRGIIPLDRDIRWGKLYEDHLCFFRCLALHNGWHTKNLERDTQYYYQQYWDAGLGKKKFHGVKISELDELEKL